MNDVCPCFRKFHDKRKISGNNKTNQIPLEFFLNKKRLKFEVKFLRQMKSNNFIYPAFWLWIWIRRPKLNFEQTLQKLKKN